MNKDLVPTLKSSRLLIRGFDFSDQAALLKLVQDPNVTRFLHEGALPAAEDIEQRISAAFTHWETYGYGMMAIEDASGFIGRAGFYRRPNSNAPMLAYVLARRAWGKGYATEAAKLLLAWLIAKHRPYRVISLIDPAHPASARVARKLGATQDGLSEWNGAKLDVWQFPVL